MIEASNICVKFGNRDILKDINLVINKGDFLSIIGPSGAGKSTLLNVISSIENNYSGTVKFNGKNICDFNDSRFSPFEIVLKYLDVLRNLVASKLYIRSPKVLSI